MRLMENIQRKISIDIASQAVSCLKNQTPENPELHLGKSIGMINGLNRALELMAEAVDEERKENNDLG